MFHKIVYGFGLCLGLAVFTAAPVHAATFTNTIVFPASTSAVDTTSGNNLDFHYAHVLTGFDASLYSLTSATLSLTHSGNQNLGPTAEIWQAFSGQSTLLGTLGDSQTKPLKNSWALPVSVLAEIENGSPWSFDVFLSERTSFNSEKVDLLRSDLEFTAEEKKKTEQEPTGGSEPSTPVRADAPEPGSAMLFMLGLAMAGLRIICGGRKS
ncbi:MAG TPA: PEP-CTERM sorting domain-containing protein [Verrucomicrobiae bacterium]|jgi:hypothetical protein|nr:PEP-CTERM sorting domain-containing protein [Verrucomicrobiae bacterium]